MRIRSTLTALLAAAAFALVGCAGDSETTDTGNDQSAAQDSKQDRAADDMAAEQKSEQGSEQESQADKGGSGGQVATPETLKFESTTVDGKPFDGATLAGKPTVMWFWAPWCPKCRAAAPAVADAAKQFGDDVNVIGVAGLGDRAEIEQFVQDYDLASFPNLADENDPLWSKFEVDVQHTYVILDADGEEVHNGGLADSELTDKLTELTG